MPIESLFPLACSWTIQISAILLSLAMMIYAWSYIKSKGFRPERTRKTRATLKMIQFIKIILWMTGACAWTGISILVCGLVFKDAWVERLPMGMIIVLAASALMTGALGLAVEFLDGIIEKLQFRLDRFVMQKAHSYAFRAFLAFVVLEMTIFPAIVWFVRSRGNY